MTRIELPGEKAKGHLTLLRESRALTPREYNALTVEERLAIIRRAGGRQKYDLIVEAKDAEALVPRLAAQEIYLLLRELGAEDCIDLLAMVSTEQMTTFLDLDLWEDAVLQQKPTLEWLVLLLETGEEKVLQTAREMDFELLVVMLQKFVAIQRGLESLTDEDALVEGRLERIYDVEYPDSESAKIVGYFLDILFRHDRDFYLHLMEAVRWEQTVELEEAAYQSRNGRLQDRGFPDPFTALELFAYLDPATFNAVREGKIPIAAGEAEADAPGFFLVARPNDLLAEILGSGLEADECWELTYLLNKIMIADGADVGESDQVRREMEEVYRYLNLGLEHLSGGDTEQAFQVFHSTYFQHLFRIGLSLTLDLQKRARKVVRSEIGPYLDGPDRAFTAGLGRRRPRLFEGVERPDRGGERPFANLHDLQLAEEWLERLDVQRRLFSEVFDFSLSPPAEIDLSGCIPEDGEDLTLSEIFLTALANRIMGREFAPVPLPADELAELHHRVAAEGQVRAGLRAETVAWLENLETGAGRFAEHCLAMWDEEFCALQPADLDPRYVGGLIIRCTG